MLHIKMILPAIFIISLFSSCGSGSDTKARELELKERELELKEKELQLKADSSSAVAPSGSNTPATNETSIERLLGYWYMPEHPDVDVRFFRDMRFEMNDLDADKKPEHLEGSFELSGSTLKLLYNDRPKQSFRFYKGPGTQYFIESKDILFVKGENNGNR